MKDKSQIAFDYAINFYGKNESGINNQRICVQEMMKLTGLEYKDCILIQEPILFTCSALRTMQISHEIISQHININSQF